MIGKYQRQRPKLKSVDATDTSPTTSTAAMDAINRVNSNSAEELPSSSTEVNPLRTEAKNPDSDSLQPITLENGEYLFTNDPEVPRERLKKIIPPAQ
jgi:hypothetical protein